MKYKRKQKLYWLPPKGFGRFFLPSSDDEFKRRHPYGYIFLVALAMLAIVSPMVFYTVYTKSTVPTNASLAGCFFIGVGLFNLVSIIIKQYLGHLVTIISFLLGALLLAIDMGIL